MTLSLCRVDYTCKTWTDNTGCQALAPESIVKNNLNSVSVCITLVRTSHLHSDVLGLFWGQLGEVRTQGWQVEASDLLIKFFGQEKNIVLVFFGSLGLFPVLEQVQLC